MGLKAGFWQKLIPVFGAQAFTALVISRLAPERKSSDFLTDKEIEHGF